jgi:hypothetical protein
MHGIMKRPYLPFLAFLVLLWLPITFSRGYATSVVPGWHTTIWPPYFICLIIVTIVLILVTIGYWLLFRRTDKTNPVLFAIHFLLTIPAIIYLIFPSIFLDARVTDENDLMEAIQFRIKAVLVAWGIFIIGQLLFLIYYIRVIGAGPNDLPFLREKNTSEAGNR